MKKMCVFLAGILLVIFIAFACKMPNSVEFKSDKFEINAPVKIGRFNLATVLSEMIKGAFPEGFEIYDIVDYPDVQAFLVGYRLDILESFNPDDYLKDIQAQMSTMDSLASDADIDPDPIVIPKMTSDTVADETWFFFKMDSFFLSMQTEINFDSTQPAREEFTVDNDDNVNATNPISWPFNLPQFMVYKDDGVTKNFESIIVDTGFIDLSIQLKFDESYPSLLDTDDIEITLTGIQMQGVNYLGVNPNSPLPPVTLEAAHNHMNSVTIDIAGAEISDTYRPYFTIAGITSDYGGSDTGSVKFTLVMRPQVRDLKLRKAEELKIGRMEEDVPKEIVNNINIEATDDMLNADIADGVFRLTTRLPPHTGIPGTTYCEGMNVGYRIHIEQEAVTLPPGPGFAGKVFGGLNGTFIKEVPSPEDTSEKANPSLTGRSISGKPLDVIMDPSPNPSKVIIAADPITGASFELCDDKINGDYVYVELPLTDKVLPVHMDMGMDIYELSVVRWKTYNEETDRHILPIIDVPPIDFTGGEDSSFIKTITFDKMLMNVDFIIPPDHEQLEAGSGLPTQMKEKIALRISSSDLGFYDNNPANTRILVQEENSFTGAMPKKLYIADDDPYITINAMLLPVVDGEVKEAGFPYMEFGRIDMRDGKDVTMNIYAGIGIDYTWSEAEIDLKAALKRSNRDTPEGMYPEEGGDTVDMSKLNQFMHGITFGDNVEAKIFLGGPSKLIELIHPRLDFIAHWENENQEIQQEPMLAQHEVKISETLFKLPGKNADGEYVYSGLHLPEPDQGLNLSSSFGRILTSFPRNLRFSYEMILPDAENWLTVYPEHFDDAEEGDSSKIKGLLVLLLPLEFIAEPGGYFAIPNDMFDDSEDGSGAGDIFGRESINDDSLFTGINIKSLSMRIDFGNSFYAGSYLHFDKDSILFGEDGLSVGRDNSLSVTFTGDQQRTIEENLIYPDIKFVFPEGKELQVGKYFLPLRIVIAASGSYTLNIDDLGLGN